MTDKFTQQPASIKLSSQAESAKLLRGPQCFAIFALLRDLSFSVGSNAELATRNPH